MNNQVKVVAFGAIFILTCYKAEQYSVFSAIVARLIAQHNGIVRSAESVDGICQFVTPFFMCTYKYTYSAFGKTREGIGIPYSEYRSCLRQVFNGKIRAVGSFQIYMRRSAAGTGELQYCTIYLNICSPLVFFCITRRFCTLRRTVSFI